LLKDKKHYDGFKGLENRNGSMKYYDTMTIVDKCSDILLKRVGNVTTDRQSELLVKIAFYTKKEILSIIG
jgi:hypothetical protein